MFSKVPFMFSIMLILVNLSFLYSIVRYPHLISFAISPGLTVGILGFMLIIIFAVLLTYAYIRLVNSWEAR